MPREKDPNVEDWFSRIPEERLRSSALHDGQAVARNPEAQRGRIEESMDLPAPPGRRVTPRMSHLN